MINLLSLSGLFLCAAALIFFGGRYICGSRDHDLRLALCALAPVLGGFACQLIGGGEGLLLSVRYDLYIYSWDRMLGVGEPGFRLGVLFSSHAWGLPVLVIAYGLLPAAVMLAFMVNLRALSHPVAAFALNFFLAPFIYAAIPVSGPRFAFPSFPREPMAFSPHVIHSHLAPNGIPSIHTSTALLACWYTRSSKSAHLAAWINLCGVVLSTLASGEHYIFDLVVAVPYAVGCVATARVLNQGAFRTPVTAYQATQP